MSTLRKVRMPPLLEPFEQEYPSVRGITEGHVKHIFYRLERRRVMFRGDEIAELHFLMRGLGLDCEMSEGDKRSVDSNLRRVRGTDFGWGVAKLLYHMRELGWKIGMDDADKKSMVKALIRFRQAGDIRLAAIHDYMHELGVETKVEPIDGYWFEKRLMEARRRGEGRELVELHYHMRRIGCPAPITAGDDEMIGGELKATDDGEKIAAIHYYTRMLRETSGRKQTPLPPVRRFKG